MYFCVNFINECIVLKPEISGIYLNKIRYKNAKWASVPVFQSLGLYNISDGAIDSIIEKYMIKYEINGERGVTVICNTKVNVLVWSLFWLIL